MKSYLHDCVDLDTDMVRQEHPDWSISTQWNQIIHDWSVGETRLEAACKAYRKNIIFDTPGASEDHMVEKVMLVKKFGYRCTLKYVTTPLIACIWRNRQRAAQGGSYCSERTLMRKASQMTAAFEALSPLMDDVEQYDGGWDPESCECREAQLDVFLYPFPADRLPPRPGASRYKRLKAPVGSKPFRKLPIGPWTRTAEIDDQRRAEETMLGLVDEASKQDYILQHVLQNKKACMHSSPYPYTCPEGVEHWTLRSKPALHHDQIFEFVER